MKDQFLFFFGSIILIIAAFVSYFVFEPFKKYRFLFWTFVFTISLFILLRAKSYYAIGLYPVFLAFGAVYCDKLLSIRMARFLKPAFASLIIVLSIPLIFIAFPYQSPQKIIDHPGLYKSLGLLRWEDGEDHLLPQDFADMLGWKSLAAGADSIYSHIAAKESTLVLCDNYGQAGAINYYSAHQHINAVSFNADYINWIPLKHPIRNIILIQEASDDDPGRTKEKALFDSIRLIWKSTNRLSREFGTKIYLLEGAKTDINKLLQKEIETVKNGK